MAHDSELEGFQDFSVATPWEAIAANIENTFHAWAPAVHRLASSGGSGGTAGLEPEELSAVVDHSLPHRIGAYTLTLHLPPTARPRPVLNGAAPTGIAGASNRAFLETSGELRLRVATAERAATDAAAAAAARVAAAEAEPSVSTPASAYSDADSRSASERPFPAANGGSPAPDSEASDEPAAYQSSDSQAGEGEEVEESPPLFPKRLGAASPTPSLGELGSASAERARWAAAEGHARLRAWFALRAFVTLAPNSFSGRVMDAQEAHVLLSALAAAQAYAKLALPCFLPVHDGLRDAYWGVCAEGAATRHYETDSVHLSRPPPRLLQAAGLLELFAGRLQRQAPAAAQACARAAEAEGSRSPPAAAASRSPPVCISLRRTWQLKPPEPQGGMPASGSAADDDDLALWADQWDAGCAWWPWASQHDPCSDLELDVEWLRLPPERATDPAALRPERATRWRLHALSSARPAWLRPAFLQFSPGGQRPKAPRRHLLLTRPSEGARQPLPRPPRDGSLAAMLAALWEGRGAAAKCPTLGQLASGEWWGRQGSVFPSVPSEAELQDVLRDLFQAPALPAAFAGTGPSTAAACPAELAGPGLPGCAPADSLAARLAMHALTFSNARAVATLWVRFVRELRFAHWEPLVPVPRVRLAGAGPAPGQAQPGGREDGEGGPDLSCGLLHQKLQMLQVCIRRQRRRRQQPRPQEDGAEAAGGSAGEVPGLRLLGGAQGPMQAPLTQPPPVMTSDMLAEREAALSVLGGGEHGAAAAAGAGLLASDMAAFKAANPGALLADFVRWHSPRDWLADGSSEDGRLSQRIGPCWVALWEAARPCAAARQKPLMDAELQGERVLHDFEHALLPAGLWAWLGPAALAAAAACLAACEAAALPPVAAELAWFQAHAAQLLQGPEPLEAAFPPLLAAFQRLESLTVAAESLRLRLPRAPGLVSRLLQAACGKQPDGEGGSGGESPFREPLDEAAAAELGSDAEREVVSARLQGLGNAGGWPPEMQSEWAVELGSGLSGRQRLYAVSRTGQLRVATSIAAEV